MSKYRMGRRGVRRLGVAIVLTAVFGPGAASAGAASNSVPRDGWVTRAPRTTDSPNTISHFRHGVFPSLGAAYAALNHYATTHGPLRRKFSTGIVRMPANGGAGFKTDADGDGFEELVIYSHPVDAFENFPFNCSNGLRGAPHATGGAFAIANALVYEPSLEPSLEPGPLIEATCSTAFCVHVTSCAGYLGHRRFTRRAVPTFYARYEAQAGICPDGTREANEDLLGRPTSGVKRCKSDGSPIPERNLGGQCPALANGSNPINAVTGNKYQRELDYRGTVHGELAFVRHYNSQLEEHADLGPGWTHSYSASLRTITDSKNGDTSAHLVRPDGRAIDFQRPAGRAVFSADPLIVARLRPLDSGAAYEFIDEHDRRERYELTTTVAGSGMSARRYRLQSIIDPRLGGREELIYDATGALVAVRGRFGRALRFERGPHGVLRALIDPAGRRYEYGYDASQRLRGVHYPTAAGNPSVRREYRYEDPAWPFALTSIIDENGAPYARFVYDERGRAISSEHAGEVDRVTFDYQAGYTSVTDAAGHTRSYNLRVESGIGLIAAVSGGVCGACGDGTTAATTFDARGHRNLVSDHLGNVTDYDIDARGLEVRRSEGRDADRRVFETQWESEFRLPRSETLTDASGRRVRETRYRYWQGRLKQREEIDLLGGGAARVTAFHYFGEDDASDPRYGLLRGVDGPRTDASDVTNYDHDAETGNLVAVTNAMGHVTRYTAHDGDGRPLVEVDPNGVTTRFEYDARGRLIARDVGGALTRWRYDPRGQMIEVALPDGALTRFEYDAAHRLRAMLDAAGNARKFTLDARGNRLVEAVYAEDGRLSARVTREFDAHDRLTREVQGEGQATHYRYDGNGALIAIGDPREPARESIRDYDSLGRLSGLTDRRGGMTRLTYTADDRVIALSDPRSVTTRYRYDGLGRLLETTSPDAGRVSYDVDAAGNRVARRVMRKGVEEVTRYRYDALNRVTFIDYPNDPDVTFGYDEQAGGNPGIGRLTSVSDERVVVRFTFDARGNVASRGTTVHRRTFVARYTYDAADRVVSITYPSGLQVSYTRDAQGRIGAIDAMSDGKPIPIASNIRYQPFGPLASMVLGNGIDERRSFDSSGRLLAIESGSALAPSFAFTAYDAADNLLRRVTRYREGAAERRDEREYAYDALERLVWETSSGRGRRYDYAYDATGNRTRRSVQAPGASTPTSTEYSIDPLSNRILASNQDTWRHDESGNVVSAPTRPLVDPATLPPPRPPYYAFGQLIDESKLIARTGPFTLTLQYTDNSQLRQVNHNHAGLWHAYFNGLGERTVKTEHFLMAHYFNYAENGEVLSVASAVIGTPTYREYIWLEGRPIAEIVIPPTRSRVRVNYMHTDQIGSLHAMTNARGTVVMRSIPGDAFGDERLDQFDPDGDGESENPWLKGAFPGQIEDWETRYNRFRDYDPARGRYLQSDPIGLAGGANTYLYAANNPLRYADPLGLDSFVSFTGAAASGFGHVGLGVNTANTTGCRPINSSIATRLRSPFGVPGVVNADDPLVIESVVSIPLTPDQDMTVSRCLSRERRSGEEYDLDDNSCVDLVRDCLSEAGIELSKTNFPRILFQEIANLPGAARQDFHN